MDPSSLNDGGKNTYRHSFRGRECSRQRRSTIFIKNPPNQVRGIECIGWGPSSLSDDEKKTSRAMGGSTPFQRCSTRTSENPPNWVREAKHALPWIHHHSLMMNVCNHFLHRRGGTPFQRCSTTVVENPSGLGWGGKASVNDDEYTGEVQSTYAASPFDGGWTGVLSGRDVPR